MEPVTHSVQGNGIAVVAIADLNGDSKLDIATANHDGSSAAVLLGDGAGGFQSAGSFPAVNIPQSLAVADVDQDGKPDLVVPDFSGTTAAILIGASNGTFARTAVVTVGAGPAAVVATDLNGDGKNDVATANSGATNISVLLNTTTTPPPPPVRCVVPKVKGKTLAAAKKAITKAHCRVGAVTKKYSKSVKKGRVISQRPAAGKKLAKGAKISLVLSRGRKAKH